MQGRNAKVTAAIFVVAILTAGYGWSAGWFGGQEDEFSDLKSMLAEGPPTRERGEAMREAIDKRTEGMSDDQKGEFFRETMMPMFVSMMAKRFSADYDRMMAMSPEERTRELDRRIDEMQQHRNRPPGSPPGGSRGNGGPPGGPPSPEQVNQFRAKMLDVVTPDQRAKFENGMKMMQQRMKDRGIAAPPGPGGGFF